MANKSFTSKLMRWHTTENAREMPWKGVQDPYRVWLSEVLLQQTRVEQGLPYYERFIGRYPNLLSLANAKDDEVMKLWEGLGYYSRARNLLYTARFIRDNYDGNFPEDYEGLLALKGVGTYTASAIASFCFGLPYAVVDGNVFRVLSRISGNPTPVDSTAGRKLFTSMAGEHLDKKAPGLYNQAIMDFGATVCMPAIPACGQCPMQMLCTAYQTGQVNTLPVKEKRIKKSVRWFNYFIFSAGDKTFVQQRLQEDIWKHLYEFYLVETTAGMHWNKRSVMALLQQQLDIEKSQVLDIRITPAPPQQLTHRVIKGWFIEVSFSRIPTALNNKRAQWLTRTQMKRLAFPRFISRYGTNN